MPLRHLNRGKNQLFEERAMELGFCGETNIYFDYTISIHTHLEMNHRSKCKSLNYLNYGTFDVIIPLQV